MIKKLPPLSWLRSFEASARHLSFTDAATELNLTQAAVSQQIKGLESQLGSVLFRRLPRGLELTNSGAAYLPAVHESVERLKAATDEIFGKGRNNLLTIKVNLVFFMTCLAPRMKHFIAQHPHINLRITSNIWVDEKESSVDSDLEIRYGHGEWRAKQSDRLTWDHLVPVCSPEYLKSSAPLDTPQDIFNHTLLHVIGYVEGWGYWLNQTGYGHLAIKQRFQFDTLITALEMAMLGEGLALGRTSLVESMLESGRLIAPLEQQVMTEEAFYLVYTSSQLDNPHALAFKTWLLAEVVQQKNVLRDVTIT